jgi:transcriptional regulator with PAS, ATPase and Fis domain
MISNPLPQTLPIASTVRRPHFIFRSEAMEAVSLMARRVAAGSAKVLITGESGVGKDIVARLIHVDSSRARGPYVAVNCATFSETLLESELFGHVKGSFTGAYRDKAGRLQMADGGTIFLDEIGEMSVRMQATLLRFLEDGELQPVGSDDSHPRRVDVRVIAATNRDLRDMVAAGQFREDLLYRINVVHIQVPPLRERPEDIGPLVDHIVRTTGRDIVFTEAARDALAAYRWPGNVRELQNVIEQVVWMVTSSEVDVSDLPAAIAAAGEVRLSPARERRKQVADEVFAGLVAGRCSFWDVHKLFLSRDLTRQDIRGIVSRGLAATNGNYRELVRLFGLPEEDYKRLLNFLTAHECTVDYRSFRQGNEAAPAAREPVRMETPAAASSSIPGIS